MTYRHILYEKKGQIAYVTLNRPEVGNAHHGEMGSELTDAWHDANNDKAIRVAILTGAGNRHFTTGGDTGAMARGQPIGPFGDIPDDFWKPVILAINGVCAGGGFHFIWQSDFAICSDNATFLEPHVSIGWVPLREMMGLANRAPLSAVLRMAMMGDKERVDARRAYELGIVTEVTTQDKLLPRATELALAICEQAPLAVAAIKEALHRGFVLRYAQREALDYGKLLRETMTHHSADYLEGPRAFAEKRKPRWQGK
jgi:enoyl-CoA hydratase/carnithine racemase